MDITWDSEETERISCSAKIITKNDKQIGKLQYLIFNTNIITNDLF